MSTIICQTSDLGPTADYSLYIYISFFEFFLGYFLTVAMLLLTDRSNLVIFSPVLLFQMQRGKNKKSR